MNNSDELKMDFVKICQESHNVIVREQNAIAYTKACKRKKIHNDIIDVLGVISGALLIFMLYMVGIIIL